MEAVDIAKIVEKLILGRDEHLVMIWEDDRSSLLRELWSMEAKLTRQKALNWELIRRCDYLCALEKQRIMASDSDGDHRHFHRNETAARVVCVEPHEGGLDKSSSTEEIENRSSCGSETCGERTVSAPPLSSSRCPVIQQVIGIDSDNNLTGSIDREASGRGHGAGAGKDTADLVKEVVPSTINAGSLYAVKGSRESSLQPYLGWRCGNEAVNIHRVPDMPSILRVPLQSQGDKRNYEAFFRLPDKLASAQQADAQHRRQKKQRQTGSRGRGTQEPTGRCVAVISRGEVDRTVLFETRPCDDNGSSSSSRRGTKDGNVGKLTCYFNTTRLDGPSNVSTAAASTAASFRIARTGSHSPFSSAERDVGRYGESKKRARGESEWEETLQNKRKASGREEVVLDAGWRDRQGQGNEKRKEGAHMEWVRRNAYFSHEPGERERGEEGEGKMEKVVDQEGRKCQGRKGAGMQSEDEKDDEEEDVAVDEEDNDDDQESFEIVLPRRRAGPGSGPADPEPRPGIEPVLLCGPPRNGSVRLSSPTASTRASASVIHSSSMDRSASSLLLSVHESPHSLVTSVAGATGEEPANHSATELASVGFARSRVGRRAKIRKCRNEEAVHQEEHHQQQEQQQQHQQQQQQQQQQQLQSERKESWMWRASVESGARGVVCKKREGDSRGKENTPHSANTASLSLYLPSALSGAHARCDVSGSRSGDATLTATGAAAVEVEAGHEIGEAGKVADPKKGDGSCAGDKGSTYSTKIAFLSCSAEKKSAQKNGESENEELGERDVALRAMEDGRSMEAARVNRETGEMQSLAREKPGTKPRGSSQVERAPAAVSKSSSAFAAASLRVPEYTGDRADGRAGKRAGTGVVKCVEVVRGRVAREGLDGFACEQCARFYEAMEQQGIVSAEDRKEKMRECSRHKGRWAPPDVQQTPESFWGLSLDTPPQWRAVPPLSVLDGDENAIMLEKKNATNTRMLTKH